jgi:hypothetical protein
MEGGAEFLFLIGYCFKKSSPLKLLGKMKPNLAGSIYVRSSIKLLAKFGSIWPSCFRVEDFFNISQSEKRINLGGHVCRPNGTK